MAFRSLSFFLGLLAVAPLLAATDSPPSLPAGNPYAPAFAALARLTPADQDALRANKPASATAKAVFEEVSRALSAGRQTESVDWGIDYEHYNLFTQTPGFTNSSLISLIGLHEAKNTTSSALVDRTLETLAFARHVGRDAPLISYLAQKAIESRTFDWLQKHLDQLSPQDAQRFLAGFDSLPAGGNFATALTVEKMIFVDGLTSDIRQVIRTLKDTAKKPDGFSAHLRVAGIFTDGPVTSIGLESADASFWLKPGESSHGITLLNVDRSRDEALLAHEGKIARLRLSSREISGIDFSHLAEAVKTLPKESLLRMFYGQEDMGNSSEAFIRNLERSAQEIGSVYAKAISHPDLFLDDASYKTYVEKLDPLAQNIADMLPSFIRNEKKCEDRQVKLITALSARAKTLSPAPNSPSLPDPSPDQTPATANRPR